MAAVNLSALNKNELAELCKQHPSFVADPLFTELTLRLTGLRGDGTTGIHTGQYTFPAPAIARRRA